MSGVIEEYEKLKVLMDKAKKGEKVDTKEILSLNQKVFSTLKVDLAEGTAQKKEQAASLLKEYLSQLLDLSSAISQDPSKEGDEVVRKAKEALQRAGI